MQLSVHNAYFAFFKKKIAAKLLEENILTTILLSFLPSFPFPGNQKWSS